MNNTDANRRAIMDAFDALGLLDVTGLVVCAGYVYPGRWYFQVRRLVPDVSGIERFGETLLHGVLT
jgi:hypothetical protein